MKSKTKTSRVFCLLLAFAMLFAFCSCGAERQPGESDADGSETSVNGNKAFVHDETVKLTEDFVSATDGRKPDGSFSAAYNRFAAELLTGTRKSGVNSLVSPLSALYMLAMTFTGAEGETLEQFLRAFDGNGDIDTDRIGACLAGIASGLYRSRSAYTDIANSIWVKNVPGVRLKDDFADKNRRYYQSDIYAAPFDESTLEAINGWVSANTDGMIKNILEDLNEDSLMCLVNAVLFDAIWETAFERTEKRDFTKANGEKETVEMMYSEEITYIAGHNFKGFEKRYSGRGYSFIAVLPYGTLDAYMSTFDGSKIASILSARRTNAVSVAMPSFDYDFSADLTPVLKGMGVTDAFTPAADFSGIFEDNAVHISQAVHKTRIEVSAEGTRAAAASAGVLEACIEPEEKKSVVLNRPFLYMIIDTKTDTPLFIGTFEG